MKNIAVVSDSNSGIKQTESISLGVFVLPMPFMIDGIEYFEDISLTQPEFYSKLMEDSNISTSQPSVGAVIELWERLLCEYNEVVHIPMSSGLSTSYETAAATAREYGGRVHVVNNHRISVTLRQAVLDAAELAQSGFDGKAIKERLEEEKNNTSIYIMVDTLKYLKKGGRITPAGAAIASVLNIKPVLQLQGEKLDSYAKARGVKQARRIMIDAMKKDFSGRLESFANPESLCLQIAYTYDESAALDFKSEVESEFPGFVASVEPLSLSVSCHIGPGALALACSKKVDLGL